MPDKKKPPTLKEQMANMGLGIVKIQETLNTSLPKLATKEELNELKQRLIRLEETKADKSDLQRIIAELSEKADRSDINALNEHLTDLLKRSTEIHKKEHDRIEERLTTLDKPQEGRIAKLEQKVFSAT